LPLFRRKKEKEIAEPPTIEELLEEKRETFAKRPREAEGALAVRVIEREEIEIRDGTPNIISEERRIVIENLSKSPILSVEVALKGVDAVKLEKDRIMIPRLTPLGEEHSSHEVRYNINISKYRIPVEIKCETSLGEGVKTPVLLYNNDNALKFKLYIKNTTDQMLEDVVVFKELPSADCEIVGMNKEIGDLRHEDDKIAWQIPLIEGNSESSCEIDLNVRPRTTDPVDLGNMIVNLMLERALSGLSIDRVTGTARISHRVIKKERRDEAGIWDIELHVMNPNDFPVTIEGEILPMGGEIFISEHMGAHYIKVEDNKVRISDITVDPGADETIGPISIKSIAFPPMQTKLRAIVPKTVTFRSEAKYMIPGGRIPVLWGEVVKDISVTPEEAYKDYVRQNEIPPLGKSTVSVTTRFTNKGSAPVGYLKIIEDLPPGFDNVKGVKVKVRGKEVSEGIEYKVAPEGVGVQERRQLIVEIKDFDGYGGPLKNGDSLLLEYDLEAENPFPGTYEFGCFMLASTDPDNVKLEVSLPSEKIPRVEVIMLAREIEIQQDVVPLEAMDEYEVVLTVINSSEFPVRNYKVRDLVPSSFDVIEAMPKAEVKRIKEGTILQWVIPDIPPKEQVILKYRVKGKGGYKIEDLIGVNEV